jgi:glucosamine-6-phosphate deaminase
VGSVAWTPALVRQSVVWLSQQVQKPVLKLLDEDYSEHGMADLLTERGPAYGLNIKIFNELQHTITGWPGGKPNADDSCRPERAAPHPKRVVVFSPEPSHDVLGMGGTLRRLVEQGHDVTVVYQTSGNLAVPDEEAIMAVDLVAELAAAFETSTGPAAVFAHDTGRELLAKSAFDGDTAPIRRLKGLLRRGEARAALKGCGVAAAQIRFSDLAFYERGRYRQFSPDRADVAAVVALLRELRPHQVFATGDRDDPSSITAVCFDLIRKACAEVAADDWFGDCRVWLYRGCGNPLGGGGDRHGRADQPEGAGAENPGDILSQEPAQPDARGHAGLREAWQQAEQHNRGLAATYDGLGLANYEAIEGLPALECRPRSAAADSARGRRSRPGAAGYSAMTRPSQVNGPLWRTARRRGQPSGCSIGAFPDVR